MIGKAWSRLISERGAALAEYAMLLAVVALVLVGAMGKLGNELGKKVNKTVQEIKK